MKAKVWTIDRPQWELDIFLFYSWQVNSSIAQTVQKGAHMI